MDKFIYIISSREFAIAMFFGFIIAFVISTLIQSAIDTIFGNDDYFEEYIVTDEEPYIGCLVYDSVLNVIGTYCGTHICEYGNLYNVIVVVQNNKIYYYYSVLEELHVLQ